MSAAMTPNRPDMVLLDGQNYAFQNAGEGYTRISWVVSNDTARAIHALPDLIAAGRDMLPLLSECDCIHSDKPLGCPCSRLRDALARAGA